MSEPIRGIKRYIPALDGLRAIAVLAVIAYHLDIGWVSGGFVGVEVFFVLSGYLITDLLAEEWRRTGRIDLADFWLRRARRLLPAMLTMMSVIIVLLWLTDRARLTSLQGDIGSAILYISNWWLIYHQVSYFESFGPASPFGHLWSLAVEEQFYLVWPLLFVLAMRMKIRRGWLLLIILAGALASAMAMSALYEPGSDPSRVYYGTDTRLFAVLIGAALAVVYPSRLSGSKLLSRGRHLLLELCGAAALLAVGAMIVRTGQYDSGLYRGGFVLLSVATAVLIAVIAHPASYLGRLLSFKPLRWLGMRSYALYLWHYPIIVMTEPVLKAIPPVLAALVQAGVSLLLAELSWRLVEAPAKNGELRILWQRLKARAAQPSRPVIGGGRRGHTVALLGALVVFSMSCSGFADIELRAAGGFAAAPAVTLSPAGDYGHPELSAGEPDQNREQEQEKEQEKEQEQRQTTLPEGNVIQGATASRAPDRVGATRLSDEVKESLLPNQKPKPMEAAPQASEGAERRPEGPQTVEAESQTGSGIRIIGDSVILNVEPYLRKALPAIHLDGEVGRQLSQAHKMLEQLQDEEGLGDSLVLELGTNGPVSDKQMKELMDLLQDVRQVVLVNTRVPKKWQDSVNESFAKAAEDYANVVLADWYGWSEGKEGYFEKDGVHLLPKGAEAYADMLLQALNVRKQPDLQIGE